MEGFAYACAVLLAAVFVRAGAAKLARPAETAAGFRALDLPAARTLARAVPVAELVLAAALLAAPAPGALAALAVLAAFSVVVARAVRAGTRTPCTCFGTAATEPVSGADLLRNLLLAALAVGALAAEAPATPSLAALAALATATGGALVLLRTARRR